MNRVARRDAVRGRNGAPERGQAVALVAVLVVTIVGCGGLALDGARLLAARRNAELTAAAAARTGSQWFNDRALNNDQLELDAPNAIAAVDDVLNQQGYRDHAVTYDGNGAVTVRVRRRVPTIVLRLLGVESRTVTASARSALFTDEVLP